MNDFRRILADAATGGSLKRLVLSRLRRTDGQQPEKMTARPVSIGGQNLYQLASRFRDRETHANVTAGDLLTRFDSLFATAFRDAHLFTDEYEYSCREKRDGSLKFWRRRARDVHETTDHDRTRNYLIPNGTPCPFLIETGLMSANGRVRARYFHKFRQINRFLELVDDVVDRLPVEGRLEIVDFGCGRSHLTFALHHLLANIRGRDCHVTGLDRKADVIDECRGIAGCLGLHDVDFQVGDIVEFESESQVNLVILLHACDTATDDALARAVTWKSDVILAVPCCQHELAATIQVSPLNPLVKHGILRDRFAAMATDALRAMALELSGYRTQVIEFIDLEHTARNILIRAVRTHGEQIDRSRIAREYRLFRDALGIGQPHLESVFGPDFQRLID